MKLTQCNDFDITRTIYTIEVARADRERLLAWKPFTHKEMCLSKFLLQLAELAATLEGHRET